MKAIHRWLAAGALAISSGSWREARHRRAHPPRPGPSRRPEGGPGQAARGHFRHRLSRRLQRPARLRGPRQDQERQDPRMRGQREGRGGQRRVSGSPERLVPAGSFKGRFHAGRPLSPAFPLPQGGFHAGRPLSPTLSPQGGGQSVLRKREVRNCSVSPCGRGLGRGVLRTTGDLGMTLLVPDGGWNSRERRWYAPSARREPADVPERNQPPCPIPNSSRSPPSRWNRSSATSSPISRQFSRSSTRRRTPGPGWSSSPSVA